MFGQDNEIEIGLKEILIETIASTMDIKFHLAASEFHVHNYEPRGTPSEICMSNFLGRNGVDVMQMVLARDREPLLKWEATPIIKRSLVARTLSNSNGGATSIRIYVQGAPSQVLPLC